MPLLHIALQEGFSADEVVVRFGGREVLHQAGVTTRTQIGLATTVEEQVAAGPVSVEVLLPARQLKLSQSFPVTQDTYVGVSVTPGKLEAVVKHEPFGYV